MIEGRTRPGSAQLDIIPSSETGFGDYSYIRCIFIKIGRYMLCQMRVSAFTSSGYGLVPCLRSYRYYMYVCTSTATNIAYDLAAFRILEQCQWNGASGSSDHVHPFLDHHIFICQVRYQPDTSCPGSSRS
jgi:hypothetical protein